MRLLQCILVENPCYKQGAKMQPQGIVLHSTGANNPALKRYVQPSKNQYQLMGEVLPVPKTYGRYKMLEILGTNNYANDWNRVTNPAVCVHAFVGELFNGETASVQTLPWGMKCWGCGSGPKGSYNNTHIQIEMCEDGLGDGGYLDKVWKEAAELCAHLCKANNLSPKSIRSHAEAYRDGYGTNHGDPEQWFRLYGRTMDQFRAYVAELMGVPDYAHMVKERFGLADSTINYMRGYRFSDDLFRKLATGGDADA